MSNHSHHTLVKYYSDISFSILIFFFFAQAAQAGILAHCKYLEESSCLSLRLTPDDFVSHIGYLKRCNYNFRIYEPSDAQQAQQHSMVTHFESLLPEQAPVNIHQLLTLLSSYLLAWEKDFPFESMTFHDSDHRFLLLAPPRNSRCVTFQIDKPSTQEEQAEPSGATGATACRLPPPGRAAILLYSLMDPEYPFGFIIRSASGKKTYLICREPALFHSPSPSVTQPAIASSSFYLPSPTPQQEMTPSDLIISLLTQQLTLQNTFSDCPPEN